MLAVGNQVLVPAEVIAMVSGLPGAHPQGQRCTTILLANPFFGGLPENLAGGVAHEGGQLSCSLRRNHGRVVPVAGGMPVLSCNCGEKTKTAGPKASRFCDRRTDQASIGVRQSSAPEVPATACSQVTLR